jgi:SAM-dependent methyltransferase
MAAVIEQVAHPFHRQIKFSEAEVAQFPAYEACPCCRATGAPTVLANVGHPGWRHKIAVVQCPSCELIYYWTPPTANFIDDFYQRVWNQQRGEKLGGALKPSKKVSDRMAKLVRALGLASPELAFLDVGCGLGALMGGLVAAGFPNVYGTEMSPYRAAATGARFPGCVFQGGYKEVPADRKFDVIYANHVIEHFYDPAEGFASMASHLTERGIIVLTVPDAWREPVIEQILFLPHLHSFCAKSLEVLGIRNGFQCRFWVGARPWELTAVFYRNADGLTLSPDRFLPLSALPTRASGSQSERMRKPWAARARGAAYFQLGQIYKRNDYQESYDGYVALSGLEALMAKLTYTFERLRRPYIRFSMQPGGGDVPTIAAADDKAAFLIK